MVTSAFAPGSHDVATPVVASTAATCDRATGLPELAFSWVNAPPR